MHASEIEDAQLAEVISVCEQLSNHPYQTFSAHMRPCSSEVIEEWKALNFRFRALASPEFVQALAAQERMFRTLAVMDPQRRKRLQRLLDRMRVSETITAKDRIWLAALLGEFLEFMGEEDTT